VVAIARYSSFSLNVSTVYYRLGSVVFRGVIFECLKWVVVDHDDDDDDGSIHS
jgi:hypothetical protein